MDSCGANCSKAPQQCSRPSCVVIYAAKGQTEVKYLFDDRFPHGATVNAPGAQLSPVLFNHSLRVSNSIRINLCPNSVLTTLRMDFKWQTYFCEAFFAKKEFKDRQGGSQNATASSYCKKRVTMVLEHCENKTKMSFESRQASRAKLQVTSSRVKLCSRRGS